MEGTPPMWIVPKHVESPRIKHLSDKSGQSMCNASYMLPEDYIPAPEDTNARECTKCLKARKKNGGHTPYGW